MRKKTSTGYPNRMPSLDRLLRLFRDTPEQFKNIDPDRVNEFFLIEALLRSKEGKKAYAKGSQAFMEYFRSHNIICREPLTGSHHTLLTEPAEELTELGYIDRFLGVQDLQVLARFTPDSMIAVAVDKKKKTFGGYVRGYDGEQAVLNLLRNPSPRFVCLRIDVSRDIRRILKSRKLERFLEERHEQAKALPRPTLRLVRSPASGVGEPEIVSEGPLFAFSDRQRAWTPFKDIAMWLRYLQCHDMRDRGVLPEVIKAKLFSGMGAGRSQYYSAIKQVDRAIKSAMNGTWPPSTSRRISHSSPTSR